MIRKKKLKKRLKKLKRKLKKQRHWAKAEMELLHQLLSEQSINSSHAMKNMHFQNMALFKSQQEQLQGKTLDKTLLAEILTDLALKVNAGGQQQNLKRDNRHDS